MGKDADNYDDVQLSQKEKFIEFVMVAIAIVLLLACFVKVVFI